MVLSVFLLMRTFLRDVLLSRREQENSFDSHFFKFFVSLFLILLLIRVMLYLGFTILLGLKRLTIFFQDQTATCFSMRLKLISFSDCLSLSICFAQCFVCCFEVYTAFFISEMLYYFKFFHTYW